METSDYLDVVNLISNNKKSDALDKINTLLFSKASEVFDTYKKVVAATYFDEPVDTPDEQ